MEKLDASTSPKQLDLAVESPGGGKPVSVRGIYKLDFASDQAKQLTYCLAAPGDSRPDNFMTPNGSRRTLIRLKRLDDVRSQNWAQPTGFSILSSVAEILPPRRTDNFATPNSSRPTLVQWMQFEDVLNQNWAQPTGFNILSSVAVNLPPHQ